MWGGLLFALSVAAHAAAPARCPAFEPLSSPRRLRGGHECAARAPLARAPLRPVRARLAALRPAHPVVLGRGALRGGVELAQFRLLLRDLGDHPWRPQLGALAGRDETLPHFLPTHRDRRGLRRAGG